MRINYLLAYAVPVDEGIPWTTHERRRIEIGYYHWVINHFIVYIIYLFIYIYFPFHQII